MKKPLENITEFIAIFLVIVILIGLPLAIKWYDTYYFYSHYPKGTKIINLSAKVKDDSCLWTLDTINSFNYWWKEFKFANEIPVNEGEKVVFRIKSVDVLHSFAIPRFRIGPYEVHAGKVTEIEFDAQRAGSFKYLCWLWCSKCHGDLKGRVVVSPNEE